MIQDHRSISLHSTTHIPKQERRAPVGLHAAHSNTPRNNQPHAVAHQIIQAKANIYAEQNRNKTGLPGQLKTGIEQLSGISMDDVQVHYNSSKPAQLQAHAFAQGNHIHLASGQEKHLPHEAWHVVQQKQGRVKPTTQLKGRINVNDDAGLEREANVMGAKALRFKNSDSTKPTNPIAQHNQVVQGMFLPQAEREIEEDQMTLKHEWFLARDQDRREDLKLISEMQVATAVRPEAIMVAGPIPHTMTPDDSAEAVSSSGASSSSGDMPRVSREDEMLAGSSSMASESKMAVEELTDSAQVFGSPVSAEASGEYFKLYRSIETGELEALIATTQSEKIPIFTFKAGKKGHAEKMFAPNKAYVVESMGSKGKRSNLLEITIHRDAIESVLYNPELTTAQGDAGAWITGHDIAPGKGGETSPITIKRESPKGKKGMTHVSLNIGFRKSGDALKLLARYIVSIRLIPATYDHRKPEDKIRKIE